MKNPSLPANAPFFYSNPSANIAILEVNSQAIGRIKQIHEMINDLTERAADLAEEGLYDILVPIHAWDNRIIGIKVLQDADECGVSYDHLFLLDNGEIEVMDCQFDGAHSADVGPSGGVIPGGPRELQSALMEVARSYYAVHDEDCPCEFGVFLEEWDESACPECGEPGEAMPVINLKAKSRHDH